LLVVFPINLQLESGYDHATVESLPPAIDFLAPSYEEQNALLSIGAFFFSRFEPEHAPVSGPSLG
jgi:hypothetical protein